LNITEKTVNSAFVSIVKPDAPMYTNILFFKETLHVSGGFSVHHQEFNTVRTATGICQTDTAVCLLASRQQCLSMF
jgi:hypothetical protein